MFYYRCCELLLFDLSSEGKLTRCHGDDAVLSLTAPPWSLAFDWSDRLWVCLPHPAEPLLCYRLDGSRQLLKVVEDNSLLKCLGKWDLLKGTNDLCNMVDTDTPSLSLSLSLSPPPFQMLLVVKRTGVRCESKFMTTCLVTSLVRKSD